jgi:hypothetical protein
MSHWYFLSENRPNGVRRRAPTVPLVVEEAAEPLHGIHRVRALQAEVPDLPSQVFLGDGDAAELAENALQFLDLVGVDLTVRDEQIGDGRYAVATAAAACAAKDMRPSPALSAP